MSKCPSPKCNCPGKGSSAFNKAKVPSSILDKLNEKGLSNSYFEQCDYCDTVWVEKEELVQDKIIKYSYTLGDKDVGTGKMIWRKTLIPQQIK